MYLNQQVALQSLIPDLKNAYGELEYSVTRNIKARKQIKIVEVADGKGKIHRSTFELYTNDLVKVDDKIDGRLVILAESYIKLGGKVRMYRSLTV